MPFAAAAGAHPAAPTQQSAAEPAQNVLVELTSHADLSGTLPAGRRDRLARIETTLRAHAIRSQRSILALLARRQAQHLVSNVEPLWVTNAIAVRAVPAVIRELARRPDVRRITPDLVITAPASVPQSVSAGDLVEPNISLVSAPALWALGFRGQGVVVAGMDTGVDLTHPDLSGSWRGGTNSWFDPNGQHPTPVDVNGHGTQTMSVIVGGSSGGTAIGMAPAAKWIAVKIFDDRGQTTTSTIHRGFQWLLDPDGNTATADAPNVVNNSWTLTSSGCNLDFQPDLVSLRAAEILPVFAAGNAGPSTGTVLSPANNAGAIAVGATDNFDGIYPYSSRGPSPCTNQTSPTLAAPGTDIRTADLYGGYVADTGTSVAAPHVTGALALLLGAFPGLTADQQSVALTARAVDLGVGGADADSGAGRLDALAAYYWLSTASDFTVSAGPAAGSVSPGGTATFDATVSGTNGFVGDSTFAVTGLPAQATGSFSPSGVTGGTGTSRLSIITTPQTPPGTYPLTISANSGSMIRTTTVTLVVQGPSDFDLQVSPAAQTVVRGGTAGYELAVASLNGFTGDVDLSVTGLPSSVGSASIAPSVIATAGAAHLAIVTVGTAPVGTYPLTVTGRSGAIIHSAPVTLTVTPPPDFAISATPANRTATAGTVAAYTVAITATNGFSGAVSLNLSGLPAAVGSASFIPAQVAGGGTSQMRVSIATTAPPGSYPLTVNGSSGTLAHTAAVTLTITRPERRRDDQVNGGDPVCQHGDRSALAFQHAPDQQRW